MKAVKKALVAAASVAGLMAVLGAGPALATPLSQISFTWNPNGTSTPLTTTAGATFTTNLLTIGDWANINATIPTAATEHALLFVQGVNTTAPGFSGNASGATNLNKYQLYFDVNATADQVAGMITSFSYTLYGVRGGGCNAFVGLLTGLATVTGCGTKVTLATGLLDPSGINDVGFTGAGAPYADANATITPNATESGFFVDPTIANIAFDIFQAAFINTPTDAYYCTTVSTGCVSAQNGGRYNPTHQFIQIRGGGGNINMLAPAAIPEPLTLSIFGAGLAGVAALRRRRSKKA